MANKRSMNIFEAHLEKIILLLASGFLGWVIYTHFINTSGAVIGNRTVAATELIKEATERMEEAVRQMSGETGGTDISPYVPLAAQLFKHQEPLGETKVAIAPIIQWGYVEPKSEREYVIPEVMPLTGVKVELTRGIAQMPIKQAGDNINLMPFAGGEYTFEQKDVDFVTVEAVFPLEQMRKRFTQCFGGGVAKPLENFAEPIAALVELKRKRLLPDGSWGEDEIVPPLQGDVAGPKIWTYEEISKRSLIAHQVLMAEQQNPMVQISVLQPKPYQLVDQKWLPPIEKEKLAKEEKAASKSSTARGLQTGEVFDFAPADTGFGYGQEATAVELQKPEINVWAHDEQVQPGGVYKYWLRIGFFNPIAGRNWVVAGQKELDNQKVLWSAWISPEVLVSVPERTVFFPKSMGRAAEANVRAEVCRWEMGMWHRKFYPIVLGMPVGDISETKIKKRTGMEGFYGEGGLEEESVINVDFRTGITVLGIVPNSTHWVRRLKSFSQVVCADVIYQDSSGNIQRLATDNKCWPQDLLDKQKNITAAIRKQEERLRPPKERGLQF